MTRATWVIALLSRFLCILPKKFVVKIKNALWNDVFWRFRSFLNGSPWIRMFTHLFHLVRIRYTRAYWGTRYFRIYIALYVVAAAGNDILLFQFPLNLLWCRALQQMQIICRATFVFLKLQ